eukprot:4039018-Alexandrium_andersonii.AAC.1
MSASLVGSEMCIRDSFENCSLRHQESDRSAEEPTGDRPELGLQRGIPVSYTHLTLPTICSV